MLFLTRPLLLINRFLEDEQKQRFVSFSREEATPKMNTSNEPEFTSRLCDGQRSNAF